VTATHIAELDALITDWHGQRWLDLPGGVRCLRRYGRLHFTGQDSTGQDSIGQDPIGQESIGQESIGQESIGQHEAEV